MKKIAIMTGRNRGIGLATTRRLGLNGFSIMIFITILKKANQERLNQFPAGGIEYHYVRDNLGSSEDRRRLVQEAVDRSGGIHVLVNSAGVVPKVHADLLKMSEESSDSAMGINTKGNMFLAQAVAEQMPRQPVEGKERGAIVNASSCLAEVSSTNRGEYRVSKAGASMLTILCADRLVTEGILVNGVRSGVIFIDTTFSVQEKYESLIEQGIFPIVRRGAPENVADAVGMFCGDEFLYTTGNYIDINGESHTKRL